MRILEIPDENICKSCEGLRKVLNPITNQWSPCTFCEGDGSVSGKVNDKTGISNLYNQGSKNPLDDDK